MRNRIGQYRTPVSGRQLLLLAVGDLAVLLPFALVGLRFHGEPITPDGVVRNVAPFALAWFVVGPLLGTIRQATIARPRMAWWRVPLAWLACGLLGLLARSAWLDRPLTLPFALMSLAINGALLTAWRTAFALWLAHRGFQIPTGGAR